MSKDEVIINQLITQELFISFLKKKDEKVEKEITLPTRLLEIIPKEKHRWKYLVLLDYLFNKGYDPFTEKTKPVYLSSFSFKKLLIDYYKYRDFLIEEGILTVNHSYCTATHKSKSYLLNKEFLNKELSSETITVKASKTYEETDKKQVKELKRNKEYFNYLRSDKWLNFRENILEERGRRCEKCFTPNFLTLHHITYKNIFNEKPEDVLVLCEGCHDKEHGITPRTK